MSTLEPETITGAEARDQIRRVRRQAVAMAHLAIDVGIYLALILNRNLAWIRAVGFPVVSVVFSVAAILFGVFVTTPKRLLVVAAATLGSS